MSLHHTQDKWRATIEGRPDLVCEFWLSANCTEAQAKGRAWAVWSYARAPGSTSDRMYVVEGLRVERIMSASVEMAEASESAA